MSEVLQSTVGRIVSVSGIGLHSGAPVTVSLSPAAAGSGIRIRRLPGTSYARLSPDNIIQTPLCTRAATPSGHVDTIEHLMAALAILGVDNIHIDIDGPEVPILDGSAIEWIEAIGQHVIDLSTPGRALYITREYEFCRGDSWYRVCPGERSFTVEIDFGGTAIGKQSIHFDWHAAMSLVSSRTFAFEDEIIQLRAAGLALGGTLDNAILVGRNGPINRLRSPDEYVRHKSLDLIGDMYVIGVPVIGEIYAHRPGHSANNAFVRALSANQVLAEEAMPKALVA